VRSRSWSIHSYPSRQSLSRCFRKRGLARPGSSSGVEPDAASWHSSFPRAPRAHVRLLVHMFRASWLALPAPTWQPAHGRLPRTRRASKNIPPPPPPPALKTDPHLPGPRPVHAWVLTPASMRKKPCRSEAAGATRRKLSMRRSRKRKAAAGRRVRLGEADVRLRHFELDVEKLELDAWRKTHAHNTLRLRLLCVLWQKQAKSSQTRTARSRFGWRVVSITA